MDIPVYEGNLDVEELLDWIRDLDKYFDYEDVEEDKKVKHAVTRLKWHATLWWDELQDERRCKGKQKIKSWDKYFDYEDVEEDKKVKHAVTRLKWHATLWWDELQDERHCKGKQKIKSWDRMVVKMKTKFIPRDYQITLFWRMQNLRQKLMSVKEYTEEF
jgi:hypothetical protein